MSEVWCGIDGSKKKMDCGLTGPKGYRTCCVGNDGKGYETLERWAVKTAEEGVEVRFCLESTGDYNTACALWLTERGYRVSVVNPAFVKYHAMGKGRLNKTDKADARSIAEYATDNRPEPWEMADPVRRDLLRLVRRREQLLKMAVMETNRRECPDAIGPECTASIDRVRRFLDEEIAGTESRMRELVAGDEGLSRALELIVTVPGLSEGSAVVILSEMPDVDRAACAKEWAAAAGGHATRHESGQMPAGSRMSRGGRIRVRRALWMPALVAKSRAPQLKRLYDRLRERGRTHRQALVACVRKLLMIVYGILRSGNPYSSSAGQAKPSPDLANT